MAKKYGHTGTLFIKGGKYQWSYKFEHCIDCGGVKAKHKGKGLCTRCHDKKRRQNKQRRLKCNIRSIKFHYKQRIIKWITRERKKKEKNFDLVKYRKEYYKKNGEALRIISNANRLRKKGIKCIELIIKGKTRYFPAETIMEKQKTTSNLYEERRKQDRQLILLRDFYLGK